MNEAICQGCKHPLRKHYQAVDGKTYCMVSESGTSSRGIIGLPWKTECDCCDYISKATTERAVAEKVEREEEDARWNEAADEILKAVKEKRR